MCIKNYLRVYTRDWYENTRQLTIQEPHHMFLTHTWLTSWPMGSIWGHEQMDELMSGWGDEWANGRVGKWMNGRVGQWTSGQVGQRMICHVGQWMSGPMDEWANGWMDEWANGHRTCANGPVDEWANEPQNGPFIYWPHDWWTYRPQLGPWPYGQLANWPTDLFWDYGLHSQLTDKPIASLHPYI